VPLRKGRPTPDGGCLLRAGARGSGAALGVGFFSALATDQGEFAAGVVLSGGDGDGTLGIKAIKERGGLTLAQVTDGHGPHHPEMPDSAIATGFVDFALPVEEMGAKLVAFARSARLIDRIASGAAEEAQSLEEARPEIYSPSRPMPGRVIACDDSRPPALPDADDDLG
jgi:hypothetical protein